MPLYLTCRDVAPNLHDAGCSEVCQTLAFGVCGVVAVMVVVAVLSVVKV